MGEGRIPRGKSPSSNPSCRSDPRRSEEGIAWGTPDFSSTDSDSDSASDPTNNPLSPLSWPVPSHCEGTPAFPLSPGPFPPIAREPRLSRFPGPFPPIAREPRPSRFLLARSPPLRGNPGFPAFSAFLARSLPLRGNPGLPAFSWPVPSHCEGTPAFPLSPGPFPPIAREPRLSRFLRFPGPFPPIAREPRPSRFLLARSPPLRGNPGFPAFSAFLARSLPLRGNPGLPAFSWPVPSHCEGTPAFPLSPGPFPPIAREPRLSRFLRFPGPFPPIAREPRPSRFPRLPGPFPPIAREPRPSPPFPPTGAGRARSVQVRPERQKSQQSPGPTGTTLEIMAPTKPTGSAGKTETAAQNSEATPGTGAGSQSQTLDREEPVSWVYKLNKEALTAMLSGLGLEATGTVEELRILLVALEN
ncbi:proline-rich protein HaeIII subfamily 1-like [Tenebrio molitor]|uniref:proline-rich protein HaeIII subfamily 1-like n=1 Tax=Tenebrio molitor TaxID=7067 RepID=UPI003624AB19